MTTGGHAACWRRVAEAVNGGDWELLRSLYAPDAVQHQSTDGLGSTIVQFGGADEIVRAHRQAAEAGMRLEIVELAEVDDLVTSFVVVHLPNGKQGLTAVVVQFDEAGLVSEVYAHVRRSG